MNQRDIVALQEELGEQVACCRWCGQWKGYSKMYKSGNSRNGLSKFLGVETCNACYNKFRNAIKDEATVGRFLAWLGRNTGVNIKVDTTETGFIIYRENPESGKS